MHLTHATTAKAWREPSHTTHLARLGQIDAVAWGAVVRQEGEPGQSKEQNELSDQAHTSPHILRGVYYFKDRGSRS